MIGPRLTFIASEPIWSRLSQSLRQELYNTSFNLIIQTDERIKQSGAQLVANVFLADKLSDNVWQSQIISCLTENSLHQDQGIQKASIYSLNFICEAIQENPRLSLTQFEIDELLYSIFSGLKMSNPLILDFLRASKYSSKFIVEQMGQEKIADFVFETLVHLIQDSVQQKNPQVLSVTLDVLEEICKENFQSMGRYYELIYKLVAESFGLGLESRAVARSYFEYFESMLRCEFISKQKFMRNFWSVVMDNSTGYLVQRIDAEEEEMQEGQSLYIPLRNLMIQLLINYQD